MMQESQDKGRRDPGRGNGGARKERGMEPSSRSRGDVSRSASPFALMGQLSREMERIFEDFWHAPLGSAASRPGGGDLGAFLWAPEIELHAHGDELLVRADLPGLRKEDVQVEVNDQALTISGERRQDCEEDHEGGYRSECRYGSFFRSIPLPEGVDAERVRAQFRDGVLEVRMPAPERRWNR